MTDILQDSSSAGPVTDAPLHSQAQCRMSVPSGRQASTAARVLVVAGDETVRGAAAALLEFAGHRAMSAQTEQAAFGLMARSSYDLLIEDVNAGDDSGLRLMRKAKEAFGASLVALALVDRHSDHSLLADGLRAGAEGFVMKPLDQDEFTLTVAAALRHRREALENVSSRLELRERVGVLTQAVHDREEEIILALMSASEYRDDETGPHVRRIGLFAAEVARAAFWEADDVRQMRLAGTMHDIGKIGVPDGILRKPGPLDRKEYDVMKRHTSIGARILGNSDLPLLKLARDIALCHHERWDGAGYPRGLRGKDIPQGARIVSIVDAFDALTSDRVYREALPEAEALEIMKQERGAQFDPRLFDLFLEALPEVRQLQEVVAHVQSGLSGDAVDGKDRHQG